MEDDWFVGESDTYDHDEVSSSAISESESDPEFDPTKIDPTKIDYPDYSTKCIICSGINGFEFYMSNSNPDCIKFEHWVCSVCDRQMKAKYRRNEDKDPEYPPCPACKAVEQSTPHRITAPWALPEARELRAKRRAQRAEIAEQEQALGAVTPRDIVPANVLCARAAEQRADEGTRESNAESVLATPSTPSPSIYYAQGAMPVQGQHPDAVIFRKRKYQTRRERNQIRGGHRLGEGPSHSFTRENNANEDSNQSNLSQEQSTSFGQSHAEEREQEQQQQQQQQQQSQQQQQQQQSQQLTEGGRISSSDSDYENLFTPVFRKQSDKHPKLDKPEEEEAASTNYAELNEESALLTQEMPEVLVEGNVSASDISNDPHNISVPANQMEGVVYSVESDSD